MWRVIDSVFIQPDLCKAAKYTVPLIDLPDCLSKFRDTAVALLFRMADFSNTVLLGTLHLHPIDAPTPYNNFNLGAADIVKTHLEECTTRYLGFKCFLFPCTEFIQK